MKVAQVLTKIFSLTATARCKTKPQQCFSIGFNLVYLLAEAHLWVSLQ